jgi:hypothetical protein
LSLSTIQPKRRNKHYLRFYGSINEGLSQAKSCPDYMASGQLETSFDVQLLATL